MIRNNYERYFDVVYDTGHILRKMMSIYENRYKIRFFRKNARMKRFIQG